MRVWLQVVDFAAGQHDVVSAGQLRELGVDYARASRWCRERRLVRIFRGVYAVGAPRLSQEGRWMAATLATPGDSLLSHLSAACLWKMLEVDPVVIDVSCVRHGRSHPGLRTHRPRALSSDDRAVVKGIPVTSPARTFLDLASTVGERTLRRALRAAEREELLTPRGALLATLRRAGAPGSATARRVVERYVPAPGRFRSGLEEALWTLIAERETIELPAVNTRIADYEVDFVWPDRKLIVETDGEHWHGGSIARRDDAERDAVHRALGFETLRFTEDDVYLTPDRTLDIIESTLARRPVAP